jgi:uncharacterized damage-inducible protein DinB
MGAWFRKQASSCNNSSLRHLIRGTQTAHCFSWHFSGNEPQEVACWSVGAIGLRYLQSVGDADVMEIRSIQSFFSYFETIRERTLRVVQAVPREKLEWRHADGVFSPGDLARHIAATERYTFAENVLGRPSLYPGCGTDLAQGMDSTLAFMQRMHAETLDLLGRLEPEDLERKGVGPQGHPITAWKLLRAMVEHEVHHRGEIYVYLALLGVPRPPLYGLTEPELKAFSSRGAT